MNFHFEANLFLQITILFTLDLVRSGTMNRIFFPGEERLAVGSSCDLPSGVKGSCNLLRDCPYVLGEDAELVMCSPTPTSSTVCCPHEGIQERLLVNEKISAPILYWEPINVNCGFNGPLLCFGHNQKSSWAYIYNETAKQFESEGFTVDVLEMHGDAISNMSFTNGSFTGYELPFRWSEVCAAGGSDAPERMSYFMALIGVRRGNETTWHCDGVVINREWILTAAHCFVEPGIEPNIIRLGEYNISGSFYKPFDVGIERIEIYDEFKRSYLSKRFIPERYHDIALVKLAKPYPMFAVNINPICLPWGEDANLDLVGYDVQVTGWGATEYGGPISDILQTVDLKVFEPSVCDESYSKLKDYHHKWPRGITRNTTLCAGWPEGGRDACKGDSGGPLTYTKSTSSENKMDYKITLAGIVAQGYGCGLKDFPGLYIPINNPRYLKWIKQVAFKGFIDSATNAPIQ